MFNFPQTQCIFCGCIYDAALDLCPRRYLSPHTNDFIKPIVEEVSKQTGWKDVSDGLYPRELHYKLVAQKIHELQKHGEFLLL